MKHQRGFTLFELMVTISLVVLLLTLSSVVYRNTNKRTELVLTAHQVAAMGRLAESYAASAKELNNVAGQNIWSLYFDSSNPVNAKKIIMFVDINDNQLYDVGEESRVLDLPRQISIRAIYKGSANTLINKATVLFSPPDPKTKLCDTSAGSCASTDVVRIVIQDDINNSVKEVKFNFFGLIEVR
jgi:prepilin-type N-terminal cleavage/methylation domain-containing protein